MTNFSLWDAAHTGTASDCARYRTVSEALAQAGDVDVEAAFSILDAARQRSGEWVTALSLVYSEQTDAVYCVDYAAGGRVAEFAFS